MPERSPEVEQIVRDWLEAKQAADSAGIRHGLSSYGGALVIGTEASEWIAGADAFADAHVSGSAADAEIEHVEAHREGAVAWAAVRALIGGGGGDGLPVRLTLVLVRADGGRWEIVQSHASVPDAG